MIFAILYDAENNFVAAAPACDQQPFGERYWTEIYPSKISNHAGQQTAYLDIVRQDLIARLKELPFDSTQHSICATEIERLALANKPLGRRKAA